MFNQFIIEPLSNFIGFIFKTAYTVTDNYGFALIFLSFIVSIIIFPLQKLSDKLKLKDDREKARFNDLIDAVKSHYSGATAYYYTRYIHRIYHYHPIKSMRSLTGLLIQIPFFIGAYAFLSHYEPLSGSSFLFFTNLGAPDKLLFGFNLLPVIMTIFNIMATNILLFGKPPKEKIQLYVIALIFFALLYNSPSGLVLYWTFNNLFSLLKTITEKLIKKEPFINFSWFKLFAKSFFTLRNIFTLLLFIVSLYFYTLFYYNKNIILYSLALFFALIMIVPALGTFRKSYRAKTNFTVIFTLILFFSLIFIIFAVSFFTPFNTFKSLRFIGSNTASFGALFALFFIYVLSSIPQIKLFKREDLYMVHRSKPLLNLDFLILSAAVLSLLFLFAPSSFIASDTGEIENGLAYIFKYYLPFFIVATLMSLLIYKILPKTFKNIISFIFIFSLLNFTLHGFIFTGSFNAMNNFGFDNFSIPYRRRFFDVFIYIVIFVAVFWLFNLKNRLKLRVAASFILSLSVIVFIINTFTIMQAYQRSSFLTENPLENTVHHFSKTQENLVVILIDRAVGGFVPTVFERHPQLKEAFSGFVYYPNTISYFTRTLGGLPLILGGYDYTYENREKHKNKTLAETEAEAFFTIPDNLKNSGYSVHFTNPNSPFLTKKLMNRFAEENISVNFEKNDYLSLMENSEAVAVVFGKSRENSLRKMILAIGLFRLNGDFLRPLIYQGGRWFGTRNPAYDKFLAGQRELSKLKALPYISATDAKTATYRFVYNMTPHDPQGFTANAQMRDINQSYTDLSLYDENDIAAFKTAENIVFYYGVEASLLTLADWFLWMKENNVYDNTKIIIVSDHGSSDIITELSNDKVINAFNALLLLKDFNNTFPLKTDPTFMTNADVPQLILSHLSHPVSASGKLLAEMAAEEKEKTIFLYDIPWDSGKNKINQFVIINRHELKDKEFNTHQPDKNIK
jgi:YidC/Oxa1 family membrane protein insertase